MINPTLNRITLDADSGLRRNLRKPLPESQVENYKNGLIGEYDFHTIFYDVFLLEDYRTVVAMGPPLLNLEEVLLPITLSVNSRTVKLKTKTRYKQLSTLTARLPDKLPANCPFTAEISFANGMCKTVHLHPSTPLQGNTIVTHQKNNKIEWIKDWVNYYRSQFYIRNIVIYDNNSSNQKEIVTALDGLASVVPWPFPFGITDRSGNNYCQMGAINHLKSRYVRNSLVFHFDIDELLVLKTEKAKRAILSNRQTRFNSFFVPYSSGAPKNYSFADFPKRCAAARNGAYKHVIHSDAHGIMSVHHFARKPEFLYRLLPRKISRGPILPLADAYFLHYRGITTNWNQHYDGDRLAGDQEPEKVIDDYSVIDVFNSLPLS